jgi:hypothetical protein
MFGSIAFSIFPNRHKWTELREDLAGKRVGDWTFGESLRTMPSGRTAAINVDKTHWM